MQGLAVDYCVMVVNLIMRAIKIDFLLRIPSKLVYPAQRYLGRGDRGVLMVVTVQGEI
jgi:hypothetical protein